MGTQTKAVGGESLGDVTKSPCVPALGLVGQGGRMCKWGTNQEVAITQYVKVDSCIAHEIVELNRLGIRTEGSCCGHHRSTGQALIRASSVDRARELGYNPVYYDNSFGLFEIKLKGGVFQ